MYFFLISTISEKSDRAPQYLLMRFIIIHIYHDRGVFPQLLSSNHKHFYPLHFIPFRAALHFTGRIEYS